MLIKTKINYNLYLISSLPMLLISLFLVDGTMQYVSIAIVFFATIINQLLLIEIVFQLLSTNVNNNKKKISGFKLFVMFVLKMAIIFGAISFCVQFMGNKIIIPVINYVIQIFMLAISVRKQDQL